MTSRVRWDKGDWAIAVAVVLLANFGVWVATYDSPNWFHTMNTMSKRCVAFACMMAIVLQPACRDWQERIDVLRGSALFWLAVFVGSIPLGIGLHMVVR